MAKSLLNSEPSAAHTSHRRDRGRRSFLRQLAGAGLAGLLPIAPGVFAGDRHVAVLGAGLSGLHAARLLQGQGIKVTVIEARNRVGGRLYTLDDVPGHPEGGGNTIGPNYGRVIHTALELGVPLEAQSRSQLGYGMIVDGQKVARNEWEDSALNSLPGELRSTNPDRLANALLRDNPLRASFDWRSSELQNKDISAKDFFRSRGLDERALQWIDVNNSYGNRLGDTSLLMLYRVGASIGRAIAMRQPTFSVSGGNMRLPEAMAASLGDAVVTGERALEVRNSNDGVQVVCESGKTFEADRLICALPATAVRGLLISPGMPAEQKQAFEQVVYHKLSQAHMVAETPFWEASGAPASWWTNGRLGRIFTSAMPDGSGRYNIMLWINGDSCDEFDGMSEAQAGQTLVNEYARQVPESAGAVALGKVVRWGPDPFNQGAWAVWKPGQISRLPALLGRPHQKILFAGEHLGVSNSGMEGAMESGENAALDAMRQLL